VPTNEKIIDNAPPPPKRMMTKKTRALKKNGRKGRTKTIGVLLHEVFGR
jgi:hypothetical protein